MEPSVTPPTACPRCASELERVRRRWTDRLFARGGPKARYRCGAGCGWEGLLERIGARHGAPRGPRLSYRGREVLEPSRGGPGA